MGIMDEQPSAAAQELIKILVVDDSAENRLSLETILTAPDQVVVTAGSGRQALRLIFENEFAVILLDVRMPAIDGFETAALMRQLKSSERTPIIFITAFSDDSHLSRGYSLGAVDYIVAPVIPEVLRSKVAVFVDLFRKTRQIRRQAESLRQRADQLYQLTEASLAINSANSLDEILEIVVDTARELLAPLYVAAFAGSDAAGALGQDGLPPLVRPAAPAGLPQGQPPEPLRGTIVTPDDSDGEKRAAAQGRFAEQAAAVSAALGKQRRTVLLTPAELGAESRWRFLKEAFAGEGPALSGWMAAPLAARDGQSYGWVHLAGRSLGEREFVKEDLTILTQLAQIASIAIENRLSSDAREANRMKDEFLATLSHELRTPLTSIVGWTRVLRTSPFEAQRHAHGLEVIERNAAAQARLIEDLLDVSRIIAGKLRIRLEPTPLLAPIEAAVEAMRPAAELKGVTLRLTVDPSVDERMLIVGDTERLQQVGWNILSNAIKFTAPGGSISVAITRSVGSLRVRITDTGIGISPQFLPFVFDRFTLREDSGTGRAQGGLGLGLHLVRHIVQLHGGTVEAESPGLNCGASFTVSFPEFTPPAESPVPGAIAAADNQQRPALPQSGSSEEDLTRPVPATASADGTLADSLGGSRILIVDDDPDTREVLGEIAHQAGATVTTAASMHSALAVCSSFQPDLIISDIAMAGGDGLALVRELRRRAPPAGGTIPVIAVSAHVRSEDRRRALAEGFERYVTKPVEPVQLLTAIREVLIGRLPTLAAGAGSASPPAVLLTAQVDGSSPAAESDGTLLRKILIVEDDPDNRSALKTLLELNGHRVDVATDGREAIARVLADRPDVALVDIGLPEIDGNEVARQIRAQPGAEGVFLVALTGYSGDDAAARALEAGFDAHVAKPVEPQSLDRLLSRSRRLRPAASTNAPPR